MPRLDPVPASEAGLAGRFMYAMSRRTFGAVPEPLTVTRHHRGLTWAVGIAELAAMRAMRVLDAQLRDLVQHRVATTVGCTWCVDFGAMLSLKEGMTPERLAAVHRYAEADCFTALEKRAMAYADAMTAEPMTVTDAMVEDLRRDLGAAGLVELTHAIALENQRSRFNVALGITAQGYTSGDACPIPILTEEAAGPPGSASAD